MPNPYTTAAAANPFRIFLEGQHFAAWQVGNTWFYRAIEANGESEPPTRLGPIYQN